MLRLQVYVLVILAAILVIRRTLRSETFSQVSSSVVPCYDMQSITFDSIYSSLGKVERRQYMIGPRYTNTGLLTLKMPDALKKSLRTTWMRRHATPVVKEHIEGVLYTNTNDVPSVYHDINVVDPTMSDAVVKFIKDRITQWTGVEDLRFTAIYGFREYRKGAILEMHVDEFKTHALSAIVNVQKDTTAWPLVAYDHHHERHDVHFDEDDVLLYESGTVIHGRPLPFQGDSFVNVFVHFTCSDWERRVAQPLIAEGFS